MFDEINKQAPVNGASSQPVNSKPVEDIFAETDKDMKPPAFQPKSSAPMAPQGNGGGDKIFGINKKVLVLIGMILLLILIVFGGVLAFNKFGKTSESPAVENVPVNNNKSLEIKPIVSDQKNVTPPDNANTVVPEPNPVNSGTGKPEEQPIIPNPPTPTPTPTPIPTPTTGDFSQIDSDKDGLTDDEEIKLGSDIHNVDSDSDGLFDRDEVKIYKTNPLKPDTDGDGFKDGDEVKNGYNPNGPGKLFGGR